MAINRVENERQHDRVPLLVEDNESAGSFFRMISKTEKMVSCDAGRYGGSCAYQSVRVYWTFFGQKFEGSS